MAHKMQDNDIQYGLSQAWHGLTRIVPTITGFEFELTKKQIQIDGQDIPGYYWIAGSDDNKLIGECQFESFAFASNAKFWEIVSNATNAAGKNAKVVTLGTFGGRAKRYASIKIGEEWENFTVGKREMQNLLNIMDGIDGSMNLIAKGSNTTVCCQNTFNMSLKEGSDFKLAVRHTKNHDTQLDGFEKAIDSYRGQTALFKRFMEEADNTPIEAGKARNVLAGWIGNGGEMSTRGTNQVDRMVELFHTGKGNDGRTVLDMVSAVTDYYSHEHSGKRQDNQWKQFQSSEMGSGAKAKEEFINELAQPNYTVNNDAMTTLERKGIASFAMV